MDNFEIYTDGGYSSLKQLGVSTYLILQKQSVWRKGLLKGDFDSAGGAELLAAVEAVTQLPAGATATLNSDCDFVIHAARLCRDPEQAARWLKKRPQRQMIFAELFSKLNAALDQRVVQWRWVKGNGSNVFNLWCDKCCREEMYQRPDVWWQTLEEGGPAHIIFNSEAYQARKRGSNFNLIQSKRQRVYLSKKEERYKALNEAFLAAHMKSLRLIEEWRRGAQERAQAELLASAVYSC